MEKTSRRKTQKSLSDYIGRYKRVLFMCKKKITRDIIIKTLVDSLESKYGKVTNDKNNIKFSIRKIVYIWSLFDFSNFFRLKKVTGLNFNP